MRVSRALWTLALCCLVARGAWAKVAPYALELRRLGPERTLLRLYDPQSGRTVWRRSAHHVYRLAWSVDRRAVAIIDDRAGAWQHPWYFRLIVWRAGGSVRTFDRLPPLMLFESVQDVAWSPDARRLLLRGALSMGEGDQGFGRLWCLRLRDGRAQIVTSGTVTRAEWSGPTRIRYWIGEYGRAHGKTDLSTLAEKEHEAVCQ